MDTATIKDENIKFGEVYLSDLKSVLDLYKGGLSPRANDKQQKLTADFGLPVGVAKLDRKVIAAACVHVDDAGIPTVHIHADPMLKNTTVHTALTNFSLKRFGDVWAEQAALNTLNSSIDNAVKRLVDWLNHCD